MRRASFLRFDLTGISRLPSSNPSTTWDVPVQRSGFKQALTSGLAQTMHARQPLIFLYPLRKLNFGNCRNLSEFVLLKNFPNGILRRSITSASEPLVTGGGRRLVLRHSPHRTLFRSESDEHALDVERRCGE